MAQPEYCEKRPFSWPGRNYKDLKRYLSQRKHEVPRSSAADNTRIQPIPSLQHEREYDTHKPRKDLAHLSLQSIYSQRTKEYDTYEYQLRKRCSSVMPFLNAPQWQENQVNAGRHLLSPLLTFEREFEASEFQRQKYLAYSRRPLPPIPHQPTGKEVVHRTVEKSELNTAIKRGNSETVKALLDAGADVNEEYLKNSPLVTAITEKQIEVVRLLIAHGADIHLRYGEHDPLNAAIYFEVPEALDELIAAGVDLNSKSKDVARYLDNCKKDMLSILMAIENNDMSSLEDLVSNIYKSNDIKKSLLNILFLAAATGTVDSCQYLLKNGFAVNAQSIHKSIFNLISTRQRPLACPISPLEISMLYNKEKNVRLFLKCSSNEVIEKSKVMSSNFEEIALEELARRLAKLYSNANVVAGYEKTYPVLAVYSEARHLIDEHFCGTKVKLINPRKVTREYPLSSVYRSAKSPRISKENMEIAKQVITDRCDMLWTTHSNLNIITMRAVKYIQGNDKTVPVCITLYCTAKGFIPLREPKFPTTLCTADGSHELPVDVREGYFEFCPSYTTSAGSIYHEKLKMGCSISRAKNPINGGGSIGPFVDINGEIGFLTCAHVLFDIERDALPYTDPTASTIAVTQPAVGSLMMNTTGSSGLHSAMSTPCGYIREAQFDNRQETSIDAALVEITNENRIPQYGQFAVDSEFNYKNAGFKDLPEFNSGISKDPHEISKDDIVVKGGKSTHLTRGKLIVAGMQVRPLTIKFGLPSKRPVEVKNQIEVASLADHCDFFGPGDSGSAVFTAQEDGKLACIGMAIGYTSERTAVVTPIRPILDAFNVKLKVFPKPRNS